MTLTTPSNLLRSVLLDPADDAVRLVYADALDEAGQPERAEFIRVQVELAGLGSCPECDNRDCQSVVDRREKLARRERELLDANALDWFNEWPVHEDWFGIGRVTTEPLGVNSRTHHHGGWHDGDRYILANLRRGLVHEVECTAADFLTHAAALFAAHPVERVRLTDRQPALRLPHEDRPDDHGWWWGKASGVGQWASQWPHLLAEPLWTVLVRRHGHEPFATEQYACDALSSSCAHLGRASAGLPVPSLLSPISLTNA